MSWKQRSGAWGRVSEAISLGAGRERTFTRFLPSRGPQTSDWMSRTDLSFPSGLSELGQRGDGDSQRWVLLQTPGDGRRVGAGEAVRLGGLVRAV